MTGEVADKEKKLFAIKTVGIKDLKSRLDFCLREVKRGEKILITDRGKIDRTRSAQISIFHVMTPD